MQLISICKIKRKFVHKVLPEYYSDLVLISSAWWRFSTNIAKNSQLQSELLRIQSLSRRSLKLYGSELKSGLFDETIFVRICRFDWQSPLNRRLAWPSSRDTLTTTATISPMMLPLWNSPPLLPSTSTWSPCVHQLPRAGSGCLTVPQCTSAGGEIPRSSETTTLTSSIV